MVGGDGPVTLEAAWGNGVLMPVSEPFLAPTTGDHWLALAATDRAGVRSDIHWVRVRVDDTAPTVQLELSPPVLSSRWLPAGSEIRVVASDDLAGVARAWIESSGGDLGEIAELGEEGELWVVGHAVDGVGHAESTERLEIAVDATPPHTVLHLEGAQVELSGRTVTAGDVRVVVEADDGAGCGVDGWEARVDGAAAEPTALGGPWSEAAHTVTVLATDRVGNRSAARSITFEVDATPPRLTAEITSRRTIAGDGPVWVRLPVTVVVSADDELAGVAAIEAQVSGGWHEVHNETVTIGSGDGVMLRAVDRVGNPVETQMTWLVDGEHPEVWLEGDAGRVPPGILRVRQGAVFRLDAEDHGSGMDELRYRIDRGAWSDPPDRFEFRHWGERTLEVVAADRLGHRVEASWQVVVVGGAQ